MPCPQPRGVDETARVYHVDWWRGGLAARGAGATGRARAADRRAHSDDPEDQARLSAFLQGLQKFGWAVGRNVRIETRWSRGDFRKYVAELVALTPDVILAAGSAGVGPLLQATRTLPIVFVTVPDRLVPGSSTPSPGRVVTPPDLPRSNTA
jgi:hypothetical protein